MPWFGFIHPLLAIFTFIYGLTIGQVSLSRLDDWDFPLRRVRKRTLIFFLLVVANFLLGLVVNIILGARGERVVLFAHLPIAIAITVFTLLATLITFSKGRLGELPEKMRWHPILVVISLALIMTIAFTALLKVLRI